MTLAYFSPCPLSVPSLLSLLSLSPLILVLLCEYQGVIRETVHIASHRSLGTSFHQSDYHTMHSNHADICCSLWEVGVKDRWINGATSAWSARTRPRTRMKD
eukprot:CAMPEP_0198113080 /NCGR_PEP_ID=MMETSP1442-20131203/4831_1 /TAXON_ID= /ORGANISM="Craspedostauros australis, Strain CCMP3328" /LENGTH=101 /DNA_ID=CAMNT_0043770071 /DNA_START=626 /DNA_END=931 /DNA_ORIENTATION=+